MVSFQWPSMIPNVDFKVTSTTLLTSRNVPNLHDLKIQDGGGRQFGFWKMSITPNWIQLFAPNLVGRYITAMLRWHSLTHCCAWPAECRSVLHIERSWPAIQAAPTDKPMSSSTCCSQFLRGRPTRRALPVSSGRSAGVGFYWQLKCLRSRCVLR